MKYYKITNATDIKEIGKYPQSIKAISVGNIGEVGGSLCNEPIANIILPKPKLHPKAKPTTYLKIDSINSLSFLIVRDYFIEFLKNFNVGKFQSWNITVEQNNENITNYSLFFSPYTIQKEINFSESELLIGKLGDWKDPSIRKPVKVSDYQNYQNLIEVLRESKDQSQIRCNKLVLDFSKLELDLFRLGANPLIQGYIISERLKLAIENERFTGMAFEEITEVDKRIELIY